MLGLLNTQGKETSNIKTLVWGWTQLCTMKPQYKNSRSLIKNASNNLDTVQFCARKYLNSGSSSHLWHERSCHPSKHSHRLSTLPHCKAINAEHHLNRTSLHSKKKQWRITWETWQSIQDEICPHISHVSIQSNI